MPWATHHIQEAVQKKFSGPAFLCLLEVANRTGSADRWADALVFNLWRSGGYKLQGFEFKASRPDWLKELKQPEKADRISAYCDHWWIVIGSRDIVKDGELPEAWGLMVLNEKKQLKVLRPAPLNPDLRQMARPFLASLVRRASEQCATPQQLVEAHERGRREALERDNSVEGRALKQLEALAQKVAGFEEASGINIDHWPGPKPIGEAVRDLLNGSHIVKRNIDTMRRLEKTATELVKSIRDHVKEFDEVK